MNHSLSTSRSLCLICLWVCVGIIACSPQRSTVDLIVHNARIYTVDDAQANAEAFAVKDGKFVAIGSSKDILARYTAPSILDAQGKPLYPGFHDAHCHFYGYGSFLQEVNLVGTRSFEEIITKVKDYAAKFPQKAWIVGRGWNQNDWEKPEFPDKTELDRLFPDRPVMLTRIDGHALLANQKTLDLASITPNTPDPVGGTIEKKQGKLTGILIDNAMRAVQKAVPSPSPTDIEAALLAAQEKCLAVGLTSITDAGLDRAIIEAIDKAQQSGKLHIRVYAMVSNTDANRAYYLQKGFLKTDRLSVRSFKIYSDGALGSRGACLKAPYSDRPREGGFLLAKPAQLRAWIAEVSAKGWQVNTHAIGDSANRVILDIYGDMLKGKNDKRWRIEHAQIVSATDLAKFGQYNILPSVQPTHCTSDMLWAIDRLGKIRLRRAYAYKDLYEQNKVLPMGSDFPVEDINPLYGFHAAVARVNAQGVPKGGFQTENAVSRTIALRGMTLDAAYAAFEEKEKGSITVGKWADFVILERDIMQIPAEQLRDTKVIKTFSAGKQVAGK